MSQITIYLYPKCSTCKKALSFLKEQNIDFEERHIVEKPPSKKELDKMLSFYGGNLKKLFNTSGMLYREMKLKEKLDHLSKEEALELLCKNGMLVKRPFLLSDSIGLLGFKLKEWEKLK